MRNDNNTALSDDDLRRMAPSVFATGPAASVSDKYSFLPSYPVVRMLRNINLHPVRVDQGFKRSKEGKEYAVHRIKFRRINEARDWAEQTRELGMLVPEVSMLNSHDRTSPMEFSAGITRLVCLNGMTVMEAGLSFKARHVGKNIGDVLGGVQALANNFGKVMQHARAWEAIQLTLDEARHFAAKALEIRGTSIAVSDDTLLAMRRPGDLGPSLWKTFNRVQENLTRGDLHGRSAEGRRRTLRPISSLVVDEAFNRKLWTLASDFAREIRPATVSVVAA